VREWQRKENAEHAAIVARERRMLDEKHREELAPQVSPPATGPAAAPKAQPAAPDPAPTPAPAPSPTKPAGS
jgi:hypothetical protein